MEIKNLANTDIESIVECLTASFQNYFVKMPSDVEFWRGRFNAARVDLNLSFGVFENEKLVAFIIHGIDLHNNEKTAFNTGTGILEKYRGEKLVDKMYDIAIPILKENGVKKCILEVIEQNHRAIRVYNRIGFQIVSHLLCFNGKLNESRSECTIQEVDFHRVNESIDKYQTYYSWDNSMNAILKGGKIFKTFLVNDDKATNIGYFIINTTNNMILQIEAYEHINWSSVLAAIRQITPELRINNIDANRTQFVFALKNAGIENHINQYEMILPFESVYQ